MKYIDMTPKQIAQANIKRLMLRDKRTNAQIARDYHCTPQNIGAKLNNKKGITDKFAMELGNKYKWSREEIYEGLQPVGNLKDVNEILLELIKQLDKEDKKTIARLTIRMLNKPKVEAVLIFQQLVQHIEKY